MADAGAVSVRVQGDFSELRRGFSSLAAQLSTRVPIMADAAAFKAEVTSAAQSATKSLDGITTAKPRDELADLGATGDRELGRLKQAAGKAALGIAAMATGKQILSGLGPAIQAASDLGESTSKAAVVFGSGATAIEQFASTAAEKLGQSKRQAIDAASGFAIFGKAAELQGGELVDFSTNLVTLASDLASFSNTSTDQAVTAISAALRGESEPIRAYGVLLDEATLRQEALRQGLITTTTQALTPQQRVLAAYQVILRQTTDAQGDFVRTSGGLANSTKSATAALDDSKAAIGEGVIPLWTGVTKVMAGALGLFGRLPAGYQQAIGAVVAATGGLAIVGGGLATLSSGVTAAGQLLQSFGLRSAAAAVEQAPLAAATAVSATAIEAEGAAATVSAGQLQLFAVASAEAGAAQAGVGAASASAAPALTGIRGAATGATGALSFLGPAALVAAAGLAVVVGLDAGYRALRSEIDATKFSVDELAKSVAEGDFAEQAKALADRANDSTWERFTGAIGDSLSAGTFGRFGESGMEQVKRKFDEMSGSVKQSLQSIPKAMREQFIDEIVPTIAAGAGASRAEVRKWAEEINADVDKIELGNKIRQDADMGSVALDGLGDTIDETMGRWEKFATTTRDAVTPLFAALDAQGSVDDAAASVEEKRQVLADILQRNTDSIRSARSALVESREALRQAQADTGPFSEAADRARKEAQSAEDRLLDIRRELAKAIYDKAERDRKIAAGDLENLGPAQFTPDFSERLAVAQRDVDRARGQVADVVAGRSDQVVAAQRRVTDAQAKLNVEMGKAGPGSKAAADAQRDYERAVLAGVKSVSDQDVALAQLRDELEKHPDLLATSGSSIDVWAAKLGLAADVVARLKGEFAGVAAAAGVAGVAPVAPPRQETPVSGQGDGALFYLASTATASIESRRAAAVAAAQRAGQTAQAGQLATLSVDQFLAWEKFLAGLQPRAAGGEVVPGVDYLVGEHRPEILRLSRGGGEIVPSVPKALSSAGGVAGGGDLGRVVAELRAMVAAVAAMGRPNITAGPSAVEIRREIEAYDRTTRWRLQAGRAG